MTKVSRSELHNSDTMTKVSRSELDNSDTMTKVSRSELHNSKRSRCEDKKANLSAAADLYLMTDEAEYLKRPEGNRWKNKQRTLILCTRRISPRYRHLLDDLKKLMPHHKAENKWERRQSLRDINELCELKHCNNAVMFEARKGVELFMWVNKTPGGPSAKLQVLNVHTMGELKLTGNCLLHSRPLLTFDQQFSELPHLRLLKELFVQVFGTPRNHPLSKPFHDHVLSFFWHDDKIWFRHYQISPRTDADANVPHRQLFTEIGPRFVLDPIKIFDESFGGKTLWQNPFYLSPVQVRAALSKRLASKTVNRLQDDDRRKNRQASHALDISFVEDDEATFGVDDL